MVSKKYIIVAGAVATVLIGAASLAIAQNSEMMQTNASMRIDQMHGDGGQQPVLQVGPKGEALMRGTITVVGTTSLTVKSWGGDWTVNVSADTKLQPQTTGISQFTVGEFVGVQGVVSQTAPWTIDARLVRDWTAKKTMMEDRKEEKKDNQEHSQGGGNSQGVQAQINAILEKIKQIQEQIKAQGGTTSGQ